MKEFKSKGTVVKNAIQWTGVNTHQITVFVSNCFADNFGDDGALQIQSSGTVITIPVGDWLIKDSFGKYHCCQNYIFQTTQML